jgi:transcriptional regulator with XRE-family HTH domain
MTDERLTIREWRTRRFLTQQELGEKVGVTYMSISNWENGIKVPRAKHMRALAEALGISPEQIAPTPRGKERPVAA